MSRTTCAISGLQFSSSYLDNLIISHKEGYFHPIFAAPKNALHKLYLGHCRGLLSNADSYLLFLAILNESGQVTWEHPVTLDPNDPVTIQLLENNFNQLVTVLQKTALVTTANFSQPDFICAFDNSKLAQVTNWIKAWEDNLSDFFNERADDRLKTNLAKVEADLSYQIKSGNDPATYSDVVAAWANKASGGFPPSKYTLYVKTIKTCFDANKMFATPLSLLKEIKDYCECNIDAGSIHFHKLMEVIHAGISKHTDYLGGSSLALGYTILPSSTNPVINKTLTDDKIHTIIQSATDNEPSRLAYPDATSYIKARLAYRVSIQTAKAKAKAEAKTNSLGDL